MTSKSYFHRTSSANRDRIWEPFASIHFCSIGLLIHLEVEEESRNSRNLLTVSYGVVVAAEVLQPWACSSGLGEDEWGLLQHT